ncbi:MAG: putative toxin-antitoxin system toxin component, PIN family [Lachnospiraceae bacterium]|jgi:putative PIN family toxin of toxin-antitoxin system|nr:putative toxin-antitoxin system toxin component, PIN family [Lachnospiraceae bacterium]
MKKVVIDTNVLVSSILTFDGNPARVMKQISNKQVTLVYCPEILREYERVLMYDKLNIASQTQLKIINEITKLGVMIEPIPSNIILSDETDCIFYDTAKTCEAILITGNIKHYPNEPFIMTPASFLLQH